MAVTRIVSARELILALDEIEAALGRDHFIETVGLEAALPVIEHQEPELFRGATLGWLRPGQVSRAQWPAKLHFQTGMLMRRYQHRLYQGGVGPRGHR